MAQAERSSHGGLPASRWFFEDPRSRTHGGPGFMGWKLRTVLHALCSKTERNSTYQFPFNGNSAFIKLK